MISGTALIALSLLLAVPYGLGSFLGHRKGGETSGKFSIMLSASLVIVLELLLEFGPVPMPWITMANAQAASNSSVYLSSLIGAGGIGVLVVFANALLCIALKGRIRFAWIPAAVLLVFSAIPIDSSIQSVRNNEMIRVGVVQPGFSADQWADINDFSRVDTLLELSKSVLSVDTSRQPALIVWPETALPFSTDTDTMLAMTTKLSGWATKNNVNVLSGGILASPDGPYRSPGQYPAFFRNSAQLYARDGDHATTAKNLMVPFAEYVPFSKSFPSLAALAVPSGGVAGYLPGSAPGLLSIDGHPVGILICFESVFSTYASKLVSSGAEYLIVMTQDGWWRGTSAYKQHAMFTRYRAAETGRPIVQVSVDGLSGVIDSNGMLRDQTQIGEQEVTVVKVSPGNRDTIFMRFGFLFRILALLAWSGVAFFKFR
jgi:apolipoprotein N-acyltransferase